MSTISKRKAPMSVTAGLLSSEQAGQPGGASSTSKRVKVDQGGSEEEEEDLAGDLDLQEQERKRLQQGRKGRVVTAGYDSDEDSDDSGGDDKGNDKVAGVDEDDDMFELEEQNGVEEGSKAKNTNKGKKFLELKDIEGQEFDPSVDIEGEDRDAELELETDEEEYEVDEEEKEALYDADDVIQPLKKKKPKPGDKEDMGFQMDNFNMKNEMETGRFDEDGNYIANAKDPHAEHDKWLNGHYSRKSIQSAKESRDKREKERKKKEKEVENSALDEDECKMKLAELMQKGESVLEALQRVGSQVKRSNVKSKKAKEAQKEAVTSEVENAKQELEQLTSLSSAIMSRFGIINIYDETYESLLRVVRRSGLVRETWDPAVSRQKKEKNGLEQQEDQEDQRQFTYKWSPSYLAATTDSPNPDVQIFGPYSAQDLKSWYADGYFGDQGERILLKQSSDDETIAQGWKRWEQIF